MFMRIDVPAPAGATGNSVVDIEHEVPAQQQAVVNLRVADPAIARKLRVFVELEGERRELVECISPSSHPAVLNRMISAALNAPAAFANGLNVFEQRLLGVLVIGADCLLSGGNIARALEAFYEGFGEQDIHEAIAGLREKLAKAMLPVTIAGEPESGYRLQSTKR